MNKAEKREQQMIQVYADKMERAKSMMVNAQVLIDAVLGMVVVIDTRDNSNVGYNLEGDFASAETMLAAAHRVGKDVGFSPRYLAALATVSAALDNPETADAFAQAVRRRQVIAGFRGPKKDLPPPSPDAPVLVANASTIVPQGILNVNPYYQSLLSADN